MKKPEDTPSVDKRDATADPDVPLNIHWSSEEYYKRIRAHVTQRVARLGLMHGDIIRSNIATTGSSHLAFLYCMYLGRDALHDVHWHMRLDGTPGLRGVCHPFYFDWWPLEVVSRVSDAQG